MPGRSHTQDGLTTFRPLLGLCVLHIWGALVLVCSMLENLLSWYLWICVNAMIAVAWEIAMSNHR